MKRDTPFSRLFYARDPDRIKLQDADYDFPTWLLVRTAQLVTITREILPDATHGLSDSAVRNLWVERVTLEGKGS